MAGYASPETAFAYVDGKLYFGPNHVDVMRQADLVDEWGSATRWHEPGKQAFGWIWNNDDGTQTAEFYSDHYQYAQDSLIFDDIYKKLKKQFPKLTELSFGPDENAWEEMKNEFDADRNPEGDISTPDFMLAKNANTFNPHQLLDSLYADQAAAEAYEALENAGGRVFIVGGAIRDTMLGKRPKDIDLMVAGLSSTKINQALRNLPGYTTYAGKNFGVFHYRNGQHEVEIAMPRTETSTGNGHKDFDVKYDPDLPVEEDLSRRDFTANAMAFDIDNHKLIDPHKGQYDIAGRTLRLINPQAFKDDPLRIVRAIVAFAVHGLRPDEYTLQEMTDNASKIRHLPGDRIREELDKLLSGNDPAGALEIAEETGVLDYLCPELAAAMGFDQNNKYHTLSVGDHSLEVLRHAAQITKDPDLRLAALLHDIGKPDTYWEDEDGNGHFYQNNDVPGSEDHETRGAEIVREFMRRLNYSSDRIGRVTNLVQNHMFPYFTTPKGARKFVAQAGDLDSARDLLDLRESDMHGSKMVPLESEKGKLERSRSLLDHVAQQPIALSPKDLAINGNDLMQLGIQPGPDMGSILNNLVKLVQDNPEINNRDTLLEYVRDGVA